MKKKSIFWGVSLICAAILIILDSVGAQLGFIMGLPVIKIILGIACVGWLANELWKRLIPHIFFPIAFIFMIFERQIAYACGIESGEIMSNWLVLICALLLTIGTGLIFRKAVFCGEKAKKSHKHDKRMMGQTVKYIDCSDFVQDDVDNSMGSAEIFFENTDSYLGDGVINIDNSLGSIVIHVPNDWQVISNIENSLGSVDIDPGSSSGKKIIINGENSMGSVKIVRE